MKVRLLLQNGTLTARLSGEIDHHTARQVRQVIDDTALQMRPHTLKLDFTDVPFSDSSGVGLVLGRLKLVRMWGGRVILCNLSEEMQRIRQLAGIGRLVEIERGPAHEAG